MFCIDLKAIGNRISEGRHKLSMTQEAFAERMNVSVQMISNLECGNKAVKIENLLKASEILGISTDYILKGEYTETDCGNICRKISMLAADDYKMIEILVDYCLNKNSGN